MAEKSLCIPFAFYFLSDSYRSRVPASCFGVISEALIADSRSRFTAFHQDRQVQRLLQVS